MWKDAGQEVIHESRGVFGCLEALIHKPTYAAGFWHVSIKLQRHDGKVPVDPLRTKDLGLAKKLTEAMVKRMGDHILRDVNDNET